MPVQAAVPGLFTLYQSGTGQAAALNQDYSVNGASNPATRGSIVMFYGTGMGQTSPGGVDGQVYASVFPAPLLEVTARIGGRPAKVQYSGQAPHMMAGAFQVNVEIPPDVTPGGAVPVRLDFGLFHTADPLAPDTLTIAVK